MATFRNRADINMNQLYQLQSDMIHIHFVQLGHLCESEINREALSRTAPIHPCIKVFFYDQSLSSIIRTIHINLKQNINYPSSQICPDCGHLPPDADIADEASGSDSN